MIENNRVSESASPTRPNGLSGRAGRYFLYATGEIILVVIGILIALQINNWNEDRRNRSLERQYLSRLVEDLREERALIQNYSDYMNQVYHKAIDAVVYFDSPDSIYINPNDKLIDLYQASQTIDPNSTKSTYQELISSGNIDLVQDDSLKTSIIRYYELDWAESIVFEFPNNYRETLRSNMPHHIQNEIRKNCNDIYKPVRRSIAVFLPDECEINIAPEIAKRTLKEMLNEPRLKKDLVFLIGNKVAELAYLQNIIVQLDGLINQFENYRK